MPIMPCIYNRTYVLHPDGNYKDWTIRNKKWYQAYCSRLNKWIEIYTACPYCTEGRYHHRKLSQQELSLF